ncbi:MAG: hypothetical protein AAB971_00585 [Patescibacteria group bacterium]
MRGRENGFGLVGVVLIVTALAGVCLAGWRVLGSKDTSKNNTSSATQQASSDNKAAKSNQSVMWSTDGSGNWRAMQGTPPTCPKQPMLKSPTSLSQVTSILYPGQTRGGNYKPHGGFRFDNVTDNKVAVTAPMDAYIYRGARYLVDGEVQYTFDFVNSCGIMYRLGHLLVLTPKYQALADAFPPAQEGDSRTTNINSVVNVKTGEQIATKVGVTVGGVNTFFDLGVYDLRSSNQASKDTSYVQQRGLELAGHAVCWLKGWLPNTDEAKINSLPAGDPTSGKNSDYCN